MSDLIIEVNVPSMKSLVAVSASYRFKALNEARAYRGFVMCNEAKDSDIVGAIRKVTARVDRFSGYEFTVTQVSGADMPPPHPEGPSVCHSCSANVNQFVQKKKGGPATCPICGDIQPWGTLRVYQRWLHRSEIPED